MNRPTPGAEETAASPRTLDRPADRPPEQQPAEKPAEKPSEQQGSGRSRISYVYAIGRTGTALEASAPQLTGLRDGPLRTVTSGRLTALVSSVPADAFSAGGLAGAAGGPHGAWRRSRGRTTPSSRPPTPAPWCCPCAWPRCIWTMTGCGRC